MFNVTRTAYNVVLETTKMLGGNYIPPVGTTLNEKYDNVIDISDSRIPLLQYYGLGIGYIYPLSDGTAIDFNLIKHGALDADVFLPVPFLLKEKRIGLTELEESTYRMKVDYVADDGTVYIACYLKKFDGVDNDNSIYKIVYDQTLTEFTLNRIDFTQYKLLTPTPIGIPKCDTANNFTYAGVSHKAHIILTENELNNIRAAADIMYPTLDAEIRHSIGEVCLYSGIESKVDNVDQAAVVQANFFKSLATLSKPTDTIFKHTINIGGMSPMIVDL